MYLWGYYRITKLISHKNRAITGIIIIITIIILPYLSEVPDWHSTARRSRARHGLRCCMILWSLPAAEEMQRERCGVSLCFGPFPPPPLLLNPHHVQTSRSQCRQLTLHPKEPMWRKAHRNKWLRKVIPHSGRAGRGDGEEEETGCGRSTGSRPHSCGNKVQSEEAGEGGRRPADVITAVRQRGRWATFVFHLFTNVMHSLFIHVHAWAQNVPNATFLSHHTACRCARAYKAEFHLLINHC